MSNPSYFSSNNYLSQMINTQEPTGSIRTDVKVISLLSPILEAKPSEHAQLTWPFRSSWPTVWVQGHCNNELSLLYLHSFHSNKLT